MSGVSALGVGLEERGEGETICFSWCWSPTRFSWVDVSLFSPSLRGAPFLSVCAYSGAQKSVSRGWVSRGWGVPLLPYREDRVCEHVLLGKLQPPRAPIGGSSARTEKATWQFPPIKWSWPPLQASLCCIIPWICRHREAKY